MRRSAKVFLLLFLSFLSGDAMSQRQLFTTYSMNEGLVHNAIREIYQDARGFIWIATWEGLSMYDGNKFTNYTTANGLSHGMINDIFELKKGDLYIACNDGSLELIKNNERPEFVHRNATINRLQVFGNKIIATTDRDGFYEFNDGKLFKPRQPSPYKNYYRITPLNDSLYVVQSDSSIQLLNDRYELFSEWKMSANIFSESGLLTDSKKRVWLGTGQGLKLLSPSQEKGKPFQFLELPGAFNLPVLKNQWIRDILEDDAGNFWIATMYGLVKIGADGSQHIITESEGLPANDVSCLFLDREKNIWVGGSRGVARLVTNTTIRFYNTKDGLHSNNIDLLLPLTNGNLMAVGQKGLQLYDRTKRLFTFSAAGKNYYSGLEPNSSLALLKEQNILSHFLVLSRQGPEPIFFSPSAWGGYFALKDQGGKFFRPDHAGVEYSTDFIHWKKTLFRGDNRALLLDGKGHLWVGSQDNGLFRLSYNYINDTPRLIQEQQFLPGKAIRSLYQDSKGYIWAGTRYHGIFRLNAESLDSSGMLHFDQTTGLTSNSINSIGEDKNGAIWINFYTGLDKMIPAAATYRVFNFSRFNNFFSNIQSMIFDKDHSLWLATTQGIVSISDGKPENMQPLSTYILSALLGDSTYRNYGDKEISLHYRHKQVQFEFAAPGFINEKQVQFSYRLLGGNNTDWSKLSNEHSVSYANLQPGNYRFEVRNKGWNGVWGESAWIAFEIRAPFWQTIWFKAGVLLLAAIIVYLLIKRRINSIRKESGLKQKIAETEMIALRAQMNPHFIFNCLNAIDNLIQTNQKETATIYLSRFAKLVRNVLDSSKNNVVPFHKDYESLQLYLQMEQFRCSNKFSYQLNADNELLHGDFRVPPLIIQPFVENAIHHGLLNKESGDRSLIITATVNKEYIRYTITDNGIGRARAEELKQINKPEHQSYGIQITKERVHLYNQENKTKNDVTITDLYNDNEPCGTTVVIRLKIHGEN